MVSEESLLEPPVLRALDEARARGVRLVAVRAEEPAVRDDRCAWELVTPIVEVEIAAVAADRSEDERSDDEAPDEAPDEVPDDEHADVPRSTDRGASDGQPQEEP